MEKFRRFEDKRTGKLPFYPAQTRSLSLNFVSRLGRFVQQYLIGSLFAVAKLPILVIVFLWLWICSLLFSKIPFQLVRRFFLRYSHALGCRVLLFLLGFYWIPSRKRTVQYETRSFSWNEFFGLDLARGSVIMANHVSYVDILYFGFRYAPTFAVVPVGDSGEADGNVIPCTTCSAILHILFRRPLPSSRAIPLHDLLKMAKLRGEPLVVFPEGTRTNGEGMLQSLPLFSETEESFSSVAIFVLRYPFSVFSPAFPIGSPFKHFFRLCSQLFNRLEVVRIFDVPSLSTFTESETSSKSSVPSPASTDDSLRQRKGASKMSSSESSSSTNSSSVPDTSSVVDRWLESIRSIICDMSGLIRLSQSASDRRPFEEYWNQIHSGNNSRLSP